MSTIPQYSSGHVQTAPNRWLWAAVGALGATTLAMGVALVQMRAGPTPIPTPSISASTAAPLPEMFEQKQPAAPVKPAQTAVKKIAHKNTATLGAPSQPAPASPFSPQVSGAAYHPPEPVTAALPPTPKPICAHCGTVTAVTPVERDGAGSGAGAVAGAILGGLLGNQVGGGTGKTIATVVGAVGGGYAGNTVEKRMKKDTVYQIDIRMDDGSTQRLQHNSPLSVGAPVTVNAGVIAL